MSDDGEILQPFAPLILRALLALCFGAGLFAASGDPTPSRTTASFTSARSVASEAELTRTPVPVPTAAHGTLLKYQRISDHIAGATPYRIMYTSRSVADKPVVVTGLAVVPDAVGPPRSRPTLTIGHGTTGLADRCTPSVALHDELRMLAVPAIAHGWLVAATDYEGLGTPGRHPYLVGVSEGRSMLDAALAAAQLPGANPNNQLLIAGYSQGGHSALWANEVARRWTPSFDVLGAFAGAPLSEIDQTLRAGRTMPIQHFVLAIVAGFAAAYTDADPDAYLTKAGVDMLDEVDRGCLGHLIDTTRATPPEALVRADGASSAQWMTFARRNNPGRERGAGPVLMVHSEQDEVIPAALSALARNRMCAAGQPVERRVIHGGSHADALRPSFDAAMVWFEERATGKPAFDECSKRGQRPA